MRVGFLSGLVAAWISRDEDLGELLEGGRPTGTFVVHDVRVAPFLELQHLLQLGRHADAAFGGRGQHQVAVSAYLGGHLKPLKGLRFERLEDGSQAVSY